MPLAPKPWLSIHSALSSDWFCLIKVSQVTQHHLVDCICKLVVCNDVFSYSLILKGRKSLYVRLGCRGDWPDIKAPGWDPSTTSWHRSWWPYVSLNSLVFHYSSWIKIFTNSTFVDPTRVSNVSAFHSVKNIMFVYWGFDIRKSHLSFKTQNTQASLFPINCYRCIAK